VSTGEVDPDDVMSLYLALKRDKTASAGSTPTSRTSQPSGSFKRVSPKAHVPAPKASPPKEEAIENKIGYFLLSLTFFCTYAFLAGLYRNTWYRFFNTLVCNLYK
jgi:hypothetical protein